MPNGNDGIARRQPFLVDCAGREPLSAYYMATYRFFLAFPPFFFLAPLFFFFVPPTLAKGVIHSHAPRLLWLDRCFPLPHHSGNEGTTPGVT